MIEKIPVYELPFGMKDDLAFKIYKVKGQQIQRKDYPHKTVLPHKHNYFELCVFTDGTGEHEIDFKAYPIVPPSVHFLNPGQVHLIRRGINYEGYLFIFSRDFFNLRFKNLEIIPGYPLVVNLDNGPILNFEINEFKDFADIISKIEKELGNLSSETEEIVISYLNIFFLKLRNKFAHLIKEASGQTLPGAQLVNRFNQLVDQNFDEIHNVKEYGELLGESPVQLNRVVKKITGKTASEIIIERLILEAKRLLIYSDMSNKEIAYKLNYEDPSYFSRIFRKKTGMSPTEFRSQLRKRYQD